MTANSIILNISKSLKRLGLAIMWLEVIAIIWILDSLLSKPEWSNMSALEYGIIFSSLLLALCILFLQHKYNLSLPKNNDDAVTFKQEKYIKPTLLRALLAIQVIVFLYGAYSTYAWSQLYYINLSELSSLRNVFNLIVFLALHATIVVIIAFLVKLIQTSTLINNTYSKDKVKTSLNKSYKHAFIFCIVTLFLLLYRLIPKLPEIFDDIAFLADSAQLLLLVYLIKIALIVLLVYFLIQLLQRKKIVEITGLYRWLVIVLAAELYISMGVAEGGVRALLEFPEAVIPTILSIIAEVILLIILIRISTYTILDNHYTLLE